MTEPRPTPGTPCAWCGHGLQNTHAQRLAGAIVRRHCDHCTECAAVADTRPAWVRRAMGDGSGTLPPKVYR